jgi:hypothetical protein
MSDDAPTNEISKAITDELKQGFDTLQQAYHAALQRTPSEADRCKVVYEIVESMRQSIASLYNRIHSKTDGPYQREIIDEQHFRLCVLVEQFDKLPEVETSRLTTSAGGDFFGCNGPSIAFAIRNIANGHSAVLQQCSLHATYWGGSKQLRELHPEPWFDAKGVQRLRQSIATARPNWHGNKTSQWGRWIEDIICWPDSETLSPQLLRVGNVILSDAGLLEQPRRFLTRSGLSAYREAKRNGCVPGPDELKTIQKKVAFVEAAPTNARKPTANTFGEFLGLLQSRDANRQRAADAYAKVDGAIQMNSTNEAHFLHSQHWTTAANKDVTAALAMDGGQRLRALCEAEFGKFDSEGLRKLRGQMVFKADCQPDEIDRLSLRKFVKAWTADTTGGETTSVEDLKHEDVLLTPRAVSRCFLQDEMPIFATSSLERWEDSIPKKYKVPFEQLGVGHHKGQKAYVASHILAIASEKVRQSDSASPWDFDSSKTG